MYSGISNPHTKLVPRMNSFMPVFRYIDLQAYLAAIMTESNILLIFVPL